MFIRKAELEEIEMKEIKPRFHLAQISFVLSNVTFDAVRLNPIPVDSLIRYEPVKLDFPSIIDELNRTPKITCTNPDTKNETESLMPRIVNDIWIEIL
jgi:hypothetical protein